MSHSFENPVTFEVKWWLLEYAAKFDKNSALLMSEKDIPGRIMQNTTIVKFNNLINAIQNGFLSEN